MFLSSFIKKLNILDIFPNNTHIYTVMTIHPVGYQFSHAVRRTDNESYSEGFKWSRNSIEGDEKNICIY